MVNLKHRPRRPAATLPATPNELDQVFVRPRVHLELLLRGAAAREQLGTIAGVLNLGCGLAAVKGNLRFSKEVNQAIEVLTEAAQVSPPRLPDRNTKPFIALINKIEAEARKTPRKTLVAAMVWVDRMFNSSEVEVRRLDGTVVRTPSEPV